MGLSLLKREWAVAGIFRGPGLSGTNNSAIFYASLIPSLFYFSFMQSKASLKRYKVYFVLITIGCFITISRIGIFLLVLGLIFMYLLKNGIMKVALLSIILFVCTLIITPEWANSDFWIELIEARLNIDSNRFLLYEGAFY